MTMEEARAICMAIAGGTLLMVGAIMFFMGKFTRWRWWIGFKLGRDAAWAGEERTF